MLNLIRKQLSQFNIRKHFANRSDYKMMLGYSAGDSIHNLYPFMNLSIVLSVALAIIVLFQKTLVLEALRIPYSICYAALFVITIVIALALKKLSIHLESNSKKIIGLSIIYSAIFSIWSIVYSIIDAFNYGRVTVVVLLLALITARLACFPVFYAYLGLVVFDYIAVVALIFILDSPAMIYADIAMFTTFVLVSILENISNFGMRTENYLKRLNLIAHNESLQMSSERDCLSGLFNRFKLTAVTNDVWKNCYNNKLPLSIVMCDIDDFKHVNDTLGHKKGDEWIRAVGGLLLKNTDETNSYCIRYGGDEFLVLMPGTDQETACATANSVRENLINGVGVPDGPRATMSFGVYTGYPDDPEPNIAKYISLADVQMYHSKSEGKNCVSC